MAALTFVHLFWWLIVGGCTFGKAKGVCVPGDWYYFQWLLLGSCLLFINVIGDCNLMAAILVSVKQLKWLWYSFVACFG